MIVETVKWLFTILAALVCACAAFVFIQAPAKRSPTATMIVTAPKAPKTGLDAPIMSDDQWRDFQDEANASAADASRAHYRLQQARQAVREADEDLSAGDAQRGEIRRSNAKAVKEAEDNLELARRPVPAQTYTTTTTGNEYIRQTDTYSSTGGSSHTTVTKQADGTWVGSSALSLPTPPLSGYDPMGHGGYNPMGR
jgi:hypothetical protein